MKIILSNTDVPLGAVLTCKLAKVAFEWGNESKLPLNSTISLTSSHSISRHVARLHPNLELYPSNTLHRTEVDHWLSLSCGPLGCNNDMTTAILNQLNMALAPSLFLTSGKLTIADLELFALLYKCKEWQAKLASNSCPPHVLRWFNHIKANVEPLLASLPGEVLSVVRSRAEEGAPFARREDGGKFVELPDAKMGEVVVRFPPEASGYLHIGHAKAALLNQYYQKAFKGKLIMRFDDTNPDKEKADFEHVILEDLKLLQVEPDVFTFTSDYFDRMLEMCSDLLRRGLAYVDDTDPEEMKKERDAKVEGKNRNNAPEKNLAMWEEMKKATPLGQRCCVRAKIDMTSPNGCMRDPTIYRCKTEPHPRTGNRYNVYPTYDFACPIVDSLEGVTHALRTTEYHDRDEQFFWFLEKLRLRKLHIYEYSRLNMTNTVLSKRKLTWFVAQGLVDGWDDPRFPTVRGILRQGMTVEGLKEFIVAQGSSRSVVNMEWDKIWSFNKKVVDREASRYTALEGDMVPVLVQGAREEAKEAPKHPKDPTKGTKVVWVGPKVFIEAADAELLKEGENATFINWGNLKVLRVLRKAGVVERVEAQLNLDNTDFKKTPKLTWLPETSRAPWTPLVCSYFGHLISKGVLAKDEDFKNFVNDCTRRDVKMVGEDDLKTLKAGDIIQLQRKGFFRVDEAYRGYSAASCRESPVVLFYVPDGHSKDNKLSAKEAKQSAKGKRAEKSPSPVASPVGGETTPLQIHQQIKLQGDKIRKLKSEKADKSVVMPEVEVLKTLKARFKDAAGKEWTPDIDVSAFSAPLSPQAPPAPAPQSPSSGALDIHNRIVAQGDKVRVLKSQGADKQAVKAEVEVLLELKKQFKAKTDLDWKPDIDVGAFASPAGGVAKGAAPEGGHDLGAKVKAQGDKIRALKASKADKAAIKGEVELLLNLKNEFLTATGTEWKPDAPAAPAPVPKASTASPAGASGPTLDPSSSSGAEIHSRIVAQGNKVRALKEAKADKEAIKAEVALLLSLKADFKRISGHDWKPDANSGAAASPPGGAKEPPKAPPSGALEIHARIKAQGEKVRALKAQKAAKEAVGAEVGVLLALKKDFKDLTNVDWKPDIDPSSLSGPPKEGVGPRAAPQAPLKKPPPKEAKRPKGEDLGGAGKKVTRLGLEALKEENLSEWYSQVITKAEMIEYYNVSGCYILRPWSYRIWELVKDFFDAEIKKLGVENAYFPIFVSKEALEREKDHISDFSPEVAWVTRSGSSDLAEPVAIRPTSETVMYPAFAKWIQSHRDLPIRLNQWNNVVRWEFKQPTPFLRTREFLWQEGHTAFATQEEATEEVYVILNLYARIYEELLAVPVVRGHKTQKEKFAGSDFTTTTEAFISASGRGIQGATSHHLGQNFSKMFDIVFEDPKTQEKKHVFQNSWGLTTRTLGVMVMIHGDNKGLVIPPRVAPFQVVIMPVGITAGTSEEARNSLVKYCSEVEQELKENGIRVRCDLRDNVTPAWKFNHWELKGVPLRMEVGPRELEAGRVFAVRRDTGEKESLERVFIARRIFNLLETIHQEMFDKAKEDLDTHMVEAHQWSDFTRSLDGGNVMLAPFCGEEECEDAIKKDSAKEEPSEAGAPSMGAKGLCIPFKQPGKVQGLKCIHPKCPRSPKFYTLFGRSY